MQNRHLDDLIDDRLRTDVANARRLVERFGRDLHWCDPWGKWLCWDGKRWAVDADLRVEAMSKRVSQSVWDSVTTLLPDAKADNAKQLLSFARSTASRRGIADLIELAKSEAGVPVLPAKLDAHPWRLNCANGTLDLKTGRLHSHARADLLTKVCPHEYLEGAAGDCPLWEQAVDLILGGNPALVSFVQRLLGSTLVGETVDHIFPIFWGDGSNGKTVLLETVMDVLGSDYACKMASEVLLASRTDRHPTELADLHGKRLVVASETDDGRRLREGMLKELTGGDTIKARRMREDFWEFAPSHSLLLLTNHRPNVRGTDHALWRRLCLVPFTQRFWDADRGETGPVHLQADKELRAKLQAEHAGILKWLIAGCLDWQRNGLRMPPEVQAATAEYRVTENLLGQFFEARCMFGDAYTVKAKDVRAAYEEWCKEHGHHPVNGTIFGKAVKERNVERKISNGTWYTGMALTE